jgi:hypothetical protein
MLNTNNRTFSRDTNKMRSAQDYINRKKAESLYLTSKKNNISNTPVSLDTKCEINSLGQTNINSYELLMNISKGRYYTAYDGRQIQLRNSSGGNTSVFAKINNCAATKFFLENPKTNIFIPITQTWDLYEGSYLVNTKPDISNISQECNCSTNTISQNKNVTIVSVPTSGNINLQTKEMLARWNNTNPLRGFRFPNNVCLYNF